MWAINLLKQSRHILVVVVLFISACSMFRTALKMELPTEQREKPKQSFDVLRSQVHLLNHTMGGYPPRFESDSVKRKLFAMWKEALLDARAYYNIKGETEGILWLLAELYRQGHNIDVKGSAVFAAEALEKCLYNYPNSLACHFSNVYFFLSVAPTSQNLEQAENSLVKLKKVSDIRRQEKVDDAFIFLYAYQKNYSEAIKQIDSYLVRYPRSSKRSMFIKIRSLMKAHKEVYPGGDITGPAGMWE